MTDTFEQKLEHLLNCESMENGSDTPDFILAQYLRGCLDVWNTSVCAREKWYGRKIGESISGGFEVNGDPLPPPSEPS